MGVPLDELVNDLLDEVGPSHYTRLDLRLSHPILKEDMVHRLTQSAPSEIGGVKVSKVNDLDGVKYILEDDSWLLIRPSGTEPVLRVYAEATTPEKVEALLDHGRQVAQSTS
jgi:phosphomannomutase